MDVTGTLISCLITAAVSGTLAYFGGCFRTTKKKHTAEHNAVEELLVARILDDHDTYVLQGKHITVARHNNIVRLCDCLEVLKDNDEHSYDQFMEDLRSAKVWHEVG